MPAAPTFWHDLARHFSDEEIDCNLGYVGGDVDEIHLPPRFKDLARLAAVAGGASDSPTAWKEWLQRLRSDFRDLAGFTFPHIEDTIFFANRASAQFCEQLAIDAQVQALRPSAAPAFARRAAWLRARMTEKRWNQTAVVTHCNLDRKTVQKILAGEPVTVNVLSKLANGLRIDLTNIPTE